MKTSKFHPMNTWGSFLSPQRAQHFDKALLAEIDAAIPSGTKNRQIGNIINDLRIRGRVDLIDRLNAEISHYNYYVAGKRDGDER